MSVITRYWSNRKCQFLLKFGLQFIQNLIHTKQQSTSSIKHYSLRFRHRKFLFICLYLLPYPSGRPLVNSGDVQLIDRGRINKQYKPGNNAKGEEILLIRIRSISCNCTFWPFTEPLLTSVLHVHLIFTLIGSFFYICFFVFSSSLSNFIDFFLTLLLSLFFSNLSLFFFFFFQVLYYLSERR